MPLACLPDRFLLCSRPSVEPIMHTAHLTETPYGTKYVIDGELESPNGVAIYLRTVWIIETGDNIPRLVTAHLLEQE